MRFALVAAIFCIGLSPAVAEDAPGTHGEYLEALRANYSTIDSFDVTVGQESLKLQGDAYGCEGCERIIFDSEKMRALVLKNMTYMNMASGAEEVVLESTLVKGDEVWVYQFPGNQVRRSRPFAEAIESLEVFDPMQIGLLPFPQKLTLDGKRRADKWDLLIGSANQYGSTEQDAEHARLVVQMPHRTNGQAGVKFSPRLTYVFSLENLTPRSLVMGNVVEFEGSLRPFKPKTRESYRWRDVNGIMLPTHLSFSERVSMRKGEKVSSDHQNIETRFNWRSVNEPLADDLWEPVRWGSMTEIRAACSLEVY